LESEVAADIELRANRKTVIAMNLIVLWGLIDGDEVESGMWNLR